MHELSLSSAIVDTVVRLAKGRRVKVVTLRIGRLRQVMPDSLTFYFGFVAQGSVCEGARLEHTLLPARLRCSACAQEWELESPVFRCPTCGDAGVAIVSGNEFEVESIDVEEAEPCISRR
jgi:hydrogenase nickel incorporation protein HypA/HybF